MHTILSKSLGYGIVPCATDTVQYSTSVESFDSISGSAWGPLAMLIRGQMYSRLLEAVSNPRTPFERVGTHGMVLVGWWTLRVQSRLPRLPNEA